MATKNTKSAGAKRGGVGQSKKKATQIKKAVPNHFGDGDVLMYTGKASSSVYITNRAKAASSKSLNDAMQLVYTNASGKTMQYQRKDIDYDIKNGYLRKTARKTVKDADPASVWSPCTTALKKTDLLNARTHTRTPTRAHTESSVDARTYSLAANNHMQARNEVSEAEMIKELNCNRQVFESVEMPDQELPSSLPLKSADLFAEDAKGHRDELTRIVRQACNNVCGFYNTSSFIPESAGNHPQFDVHTGTTAAA